MEKQFKSSAAVRSEIAEKEERLLAINTNIQKRSEEAMDESVSLDKRDALIAQVEAEKLEQTAVEKELTELRALEQTLRSKEQSQYGILENLTGTKVEERIKASGVNDFIGTEEYRDLWVKAIKTGDNSLVQRAVTTGTDGAGNGGVVIPTLVANAIETGLRKVGQIANLCRKLNVKGYLSIPFEVSATDAGWHTEGGSALAEEVITLGTILLSPQMIKKWIQVTDELEAMDPGAFIDYLVDEIIYKVAKALDDAIAVRTNAQGIGVIGVVGNDKSLSLTSATLTFGTGFSAIAMLEDGAEVGAVAVMNRATFFNNIMQLADTSGQPIYQVIHDNEGKPSFFYAGLPVVFNAEYPTFAEATADQVYMTVGNFAGYTLNYPNGETVQLVRDGVSKSELDLIKYVGKLFVAGNITKANYFVNVSKGA